MLRVAVTAGIELRVVQMLARPTSLSTTAERTGLTYRQVNEIAVRHGYPDVRRLEQAVPALQEAAKVELADHLRVGGTTELHPIDGEAPALLPKEPRASAAITDRDLVRVPVAGIFPDPENLRDDVGDVTELAASIRETGLLQPIVARRRGEILIVVAGHRRLAALQLLDEKETDVIVVRDMRPDDVLAAMLIENGHRADLSPLEEARASRSSRRAAASPPPSSACGSAAPSPGSTAASRCSRSAASSRTWSAPARWASARRSRRPAPAWAPPASTRPTASTSAPSTPSRPASALAACRSTVPAGRGSSGTPAVVSAGRP